ncbi:hypothetical protein [Deinococcus pimensis]|uniref:hypothetical protein n=1 Tax=Deinococcus pimensis TaxID=309888 RepID=UPI0004888DF8|nr:hypothetical protein [Deinococcus pimensis]
MTGLSRRALVLLGVLSLGAWTLVVWLFGTLSFLILLGGAVVSGAAWALSVALRRWTRFRPRPPRAAALWFVVMSVTVASWPLTVLLVQVVMPLRTPVATLTNGSRTVEFHGMMHAASRAYYADVTRDVEAARNAGVPVLFEKVQPGTARNTRRFRQLSGVPIGELGEVYAVLSTICGLTGQKTEMSDIYRRLNERAPGFEVADVSVDDMVREWDRLVRTRPGFAAQETAGPATTIEGLGEDDLALVRSLPRSFERVTAPVCLTAMRLVLRRPAAPPTPFLRQVVRDYRDRHLAGVIARHEAGRLVVVYGTAHLDGTLQALKELDPAWRVKSVRYRSALPSAGVW